MLYPSFVCIACREEEGRGSSKKDDDDPHYIRLFLPRTQKGALRLFFSFRSANTHCIRQEDPPSPLVLNA